MVEIRPKTAFSQLQNEIYDIFISFDIDFYFESNGVYIEVNWGQIWQKMVQMEPKAEFSPFQIRHTSFANYSIVFSFLNLMVWLSGSDQGHLGQSDQQWPE